MEGVIEVMFFGWLLSGFFASFLVEVFLVVGLLFVFSIVFYGFVGLVFEIDCPAVRLFFKLFYVFEFSDFF